MKRGRNADQLLGGHNRAFRVKPSERLSDAEEMWRGRVAGIAEKARDRETLVAGSLKGSGSLGARTLCPGA